jgi:hypothetical protein
MIGDNGTRGKWAEGKVSARFEQLSQQYANFDYYRFPDARAGSMKVVPADYEALKAGVYYLLEVKEVNHERLLPHKNFSSDKIARCRKRQIAGAHVLVLVYHSPLGVAGRGWQGAKAWRLAPLDFFMVKIGGSWDMSVLPLLTFDEAMLALFAN